MSNIQRFENVKQVVAQVQTEFDQLAKIHNAVNYKRESSFALQLLQDNAFLRDTAMGNQDSLKRAIINVAAVGLSLSPVTKLAYLVPRDKKVSLDISYRGYIQLAVDVGAVKWVSAELVCEKDEYLFQGMNKEPIHRFDPFSERGPVKGAYCLAKTHDGEFILTQMSAAEIFSIRNRSQSYKSGNNSPWKSDESEMIKKTVIKRAAKSWPMTDTRQSERFNKAIDVTNELDPIDFNAPTVIETEAIRHTDDLEKIREALTYLERNEPDYLVHLSKVARRDIKALEDLTDIELSQALVALDQWVEAKKKREASNENAG